MSMRRRSFVVGGSAAALATGMGLWFSRSGRAGSGPMPGLRPDPAGVCDLPEGFRYRVLERVGDPMDDGLRVPARPDGMACFTDRQGRWVLMRNHEVGHGKAHMGAFAPGTAPVPQAYDPRGYGGVSRVVIDPRTGGKLSSNLVLTGTVRNCAGGPSPWGWLTCEESELPGHGYVFLCDHEASSVQRPQRIVSYGRFNHEAVAIDPKTHAAYLTEDQVDGCLYRLWPRGVGSPFEGTLQAMVVKDGARFDTGSAMRQGDRVKVGWMDLSDPASEQGPPLRMRAIRAGAAVVRRGEGIWYGENAVYFTATIGGPVRAGQVFRLEPTREGGTLTLVAQSLNPLQLAMPDNLTVTPWGELLVAEDGLGGDHLRIVSMDGRVRPLARNALSDSEFAGVCFSPDGRMLFVNIQEQGLTLAIEGPWPKRA